MLGGVLVEGFSTNIAKSFFITGRLRDQGVRRLQQNNRQMIELFFPGGMMRQGDGWKLSVRVRLVHAQVRRLLSQSEDWKHDEWGVPLSAAHVGFAITAFSARLLKHMRSLGARYSEEEARSFMQIWRYSGHLMGIPDSILFTTEEDALELFRIGLLCEPEPSIESVVLANSLVNSAPLVAGITSSEERRSLSGYVYHVSRALIGKELADQLNYPEPGPLRHLLWRARLVPPEREVRHAHAPPLPQPRPRQRLRQLHRALRCLQLRRGRHQLPAPHPRLRRRVEALVGPAPPRTPARRLL